MEYQKTAKCQNTDALSRLLFGTDFNFDREESKEDVVVCAIQALNSRVQLPDSKGLRNESSKDSVISQVGLICFTYKGWPP